jgi:ketosteroid isomerase-like protein
VTIEAEVLAAGDALVADFGGGRVEAYFARLAPDATFLFHTVPGDRLESRAAYRHLWARWEAEDGFRVLRCEEDLAEQETVVFARRDGAWLVVHEHLSAGRA